MNIVEIINLLVVMTVTRLCLSDPMSDCVLVTPWIAACQTPLSIEFLILN